MPDGSKTLYIRGIYEVDKSSSGVITRTVTYYPAGGATLAPGASAGVRIDNSVYYVLKDRPSTGSGQASVRLMRRQMRAATLRQGLDTLRYSTCQLRAGVVGEMRYYATGETRLSTGNMFTDRLSSLK